MLMITWFNTSRASRGRRWTVRLAGAAAALATLALAPAALANGWSLQTVPNDPFSTGNFLDGVSCSSTINCFAVGGEKSGGNSRFLVEHYNGSWSVQGFAGPGGTLFSQLNGVSCPSSTFCMAVGTYGPDAGGEQPLVFTYDGQSWSQRTVPLNAGASAYLSGVSCTSSLFCMAVGGAPGGSAAEWSWNGSTFTEQPRLGIAPAEFTSVSCLSTAFCEAVGWTSVQFTRGVVQPFAANYNGRTWNGPGVPIPDSSSNSLLTGVACPSTADCQAVGFFFANGGEHSFGESYNGASWSLRSTPPSGSASAFPNQGTDSCGGASFCWAVGAYNLGSVNQQILGDFWNGSSWQFAVLPNPSGSSPALSAVSCPTGNVCEAVGSYTNTSGQLEPLAERYSFTILVGCCIGLTPHHFALQVAGVEKRGATVTAVLKKPKALGLLVQKRQKGGLIIVGLVPLGSHPAGTSTIHWNLHVAGRSLGKGTYEVSLRSVIGDILSPATPPGEITLTVKANRHVTVGK
jgi:hypothetical protein